jgi:hypothetical protein
MVEKEEDAERLIRSTERRLSCPTSWIDKNLRKRVSLRVEMITGCSQQLDWRVSTDQRSLILFQLLDHELLSPEDSFIADVYNKYKDDQAMLPLLKEHPLVLAMKASIAREKGRQKQA